MSSHLQRKENNCLNCNAVVTERFCGVCGQENIILKETLWGVISHFFQDITHYDGKFLSTLKYLLIRPGFLPAEYLRGRRFAYLNPIRLYVFTSAFFFLIFFTFYQKDKGLVKISGNAYTILPQLEEKDKSLQKEIEQTKDSIEIAELKTKQAVVKKDIELLKKDSTAIEKLESPSYGFNNISFSSKKKSYKTLSQYDSLQKALPINEQDNFLVKRFERQSLYLKEKYNNNGRAIINAIQNDFMHRIPQMLFVGLPLFALLLKLLYVRRKKYYYISHIFFTIYLFCALFIIILLSLWIDSLSNWLNSGFLSFINVALVLFCFFYLYKAMRYFYEQRRAKTILKFFLLLFLSQILLMFIFIVFLIFSTITLK